MKKSTKFVRLSVALLLLVAMLLTPMSPVFAVVIENGDADLTAADIVSEDASKREKFSRHYLTGDGTYFAVSYAEQVNYQDEDGNWIAVDNSLSTNVLTGEKTTKNDKFKVKFANKANKDDLVTIKTKEYDVSFGITVSEDGESYLELNKVKGTENPGNTSAEPKTTQEATSLGKAVSGITYFDAFSDYLDVRYSVAHEKVKEDLILGRKSGFNSYKVTYNIKEKDALATLNDDGSITFTTPDGAVLFNVGVPVMYDSEGKSSADIAVSMVQSKKTVEVTYTPSAEWLNADERVYPVTIDPTVQTGTYIENYYETVLCYSGTVPVELSPNDTVTVHSSQSLYLMIEFLPSIPMNASITGIDLRLFAPDYQDYIPNDTFVINRLSSYWMPSYLVNEDGSTNLPSNVGNPITKSASSAIIYNDIMIEETLYSSATFSMPKNLGTSNTYSSFISGYGFEIKITDGVYTFYSCAQSENRLRPIILVRYDLAETPSITTSGTYYIKNVNTQTYLTVNSNDGISVGNGLRVAEKDNNLYQKFYFSQNTLSGAYEIRVAGTFSQNREFYINSAYSFPEDMLEPHNAILLGVELQWMIAPSGFNNYTMHVADNTSAVLSLNSNTVVITDYIQASASQVWMFEEYYATPPQTPDPSPVPSSATKAILMSVESNTGNSFNSHAFSVGASLRREFSRENIDNPHQVKYEDNEVREYLSEARIMVISAHGSKTEIFTSKEPEIRQFIAEDFDDMDLGHIDFLLLLCCSNAEGSDSTVSTAEILNNGPKNICEQFVAQGVKTVVAFNDVIYDIQGGDYAKALFQLLYNGSNQNTQNYTVLQAVNELKNRTDLSDTANKAVVAGNPNQILYEMEVD